MENKLKLELRIFGFEGQPIELTLEQAKDLYDMLRSLFEKKV